MITVGGGVGLLVLLVLAAVFSERPWLRIVCVAYLAVFAATMLLRVLMGHAPATTLFAPGLFALFALYVLEVKKGTPEV